MAASKIKTMSREQLENELREALKELKDEAMREWVCYELFQHIAQLDVIQGKLYQVRCVFWKCFYIVFNYLRINGQLGREPENLDDDVYDFLVKLFADLARSEEP
jgi:hypothetical protein